MLCLLGISGGIIVVLDAIQVIAILTTRRILIDYWRKDMRWEKNRKVQKKVAEVAAAEDNECEVEVTFVLFRS